MENVDLRFCAQCLDDILDPYKALAFCKQCKAFVCTEKCLIRHDKFRLTKNHCFLLGEELKQALGRLGVTDSQKLVLVSKSTDNLTEIERTKYVQANLRTELNVRLKEDKEICCIHASAVLNNGHIVLADLKNQNLKLFDPQERKCLGFLSLKNGPRDISRSNVKNNELYLIENGVKLIKVVDTDDMSIARDIPTSGECFGVTCWKDGIAVSTKLFKNHHGEYAIQLLDYRGRVVQNFMADKYKDLQYSLPWYLCADEEGQHVVYSDFGNHSVTSIDVDLGVSFVYKDEELIRPVSVAMDNAGDIFVVGQRSHNIHHLSRSGDKQGVIYSEMSMEFPGGISYDVKRKVFYIQCVGWSDKVQVFDLEPVASDDS